MYAKFCIDKNLKCTLVQALRLCTGRTAHRGSRGLALLFLYHGTRRWWGVSVTHRPLFTPWKDPVPIVQETGWAPGRVWTGAKISPPPIFDPRTVQPIASRYLYRYSALYIIKVTPTSLSALSRNGQDTDLLTMIPFIFSLKHCNREWSVLIYYYKSTKLNSVAFYNWPS